MVHATNITLITSDTTLDDIHNFYIINATGGDITITLPIITTDGMNYRLVRLDTSLNYVTIQCSGSNQIVRNLNPDDISGNANLIAQTTSELQSQDDGFWYLTLNSSTQRTGSKILFSTTFTPSAGAGIQLSGPAGSTGNVCFFPYVGSDVEVISKIVVLATNSSVNDSGTISFWNYANGVLLSQICSMNIVTNTTDITAFPATVISNLSPSSMIIAMIFTAVDAPMTIYALTVS